MSQGHLAWILMGDVVSSGRDRVGAAAALAKSVARLNERAGAALEADFDHVLGDEVQGVVTPSADVIDLILVDRLRPDGLHTRWVALLGEVDPGEGSSIRRTGEGFLIAREILVRARAARQDLVLATGVLGADDLLAQLIPVFDDLLHDLTPFQRAMAYGLLVEGKRQSEVAAERGIARATVSVGVKRGGIENIRRMYLALRDIIAAAMEQRPALNLETAAL